MEKEKQENERRLQTLRNEAEETVRSLMKEMKAAEDMNAEERTQLQKGLERQDEEINSLKRELSELQEKVILIVWF